MKMPMHSHHGEEWALILQGGLEDFRNMDR